MQNLLVVKIGGNIIDDAEALNTFLQAFAALPGNKILVHGGGKLATELSGKLGLATTMVAGRRITDAATIKVVTMTYAGWINKSIVGALNAKGANAIGLTCADAKILQAVKRPVKDIDYGLVGDIYKKDVNCAVLKTLLQAGITPVMAPISCNAGGQLLNINADTVARTLAEALSEFYEVNLIYCFEKNGLLGNVNDEQSIITEIDAAKAEELKRTGVITAGMLPKIDNAFGAISSGVKAVLIGHAAQITKLANLEKGTGTIIRA
jgi:acetylglutamate kinase